jgi:hypothetical protein
LKISRQKECLSRVNRTGILLLSFLFLVVLMAGPVSSQESKKGHEGMKKEQGHSMEEGSIVPCMHSKVKGHAASPKGPTTGKIVILKPENGAVIKSRTVRVVFDVKKKGSHADHIHIYLDGSGKSYHLSGLNDGKHKIDLRLVTKEHVEYGPKATVEIMVKRK